MEKLFLTVLNMSLTASYVIIFVMLVRLPLKKAPKAISYALWSVAAFRLLCPFSFESMFSLMPKNTASIPANIAYQLNPQINNDITGINTIVDGALPAPAMEISVNSLQLYTQIGAYIWIVGVAVMLIYSILSVFILNKQLKNAKLSESCIYEADNLKTPFVLGFFKPRIYIPAGLAVEEKSYIIRHEKTHICRFDQIVKPFAFLVLSIHWFNPLVWFAFLLMSTDMELSCDERVIRDIGDEIKKPYAASLLSLATGKRIMNGSPLAFGEGNVKGRIKNVLNYRKPTFWIITVAVITVIAVGIGLISNPHSNASSPSITTWTKSLRAEDIQSIELIVQPSLDQERYKKYDPGEFPEIVELVNQSRGSLVKNPEELNGSAQTFYITTKDGVVHRFSNIGNVYLMIDGDAFEAGYEWLSMWDYKGNSAVPDSFWEKVSSDVPVSKVGVPGLPTDTKLSFTSAETDLTKLGTIAFGEYVSLKTSGQTPATERVASYQLNDISLLAGDINEFCVSMNYDFTTDNDNFVSPGNGAKGKGTWPDNYMEIRIKNIDGHAYEIVSVGTGGGGQGLVPYAPQQTTLAPTSPELSFEQTVSVDMAELDYASNDIVIFHDYFGLFVYDLNTLEIIRSLDLKPLNCHQTQGDGYCEVSVSMDGNTVQLHPMSSENMYVYSVSDNTLQETTHQPMENRFSSFVPIEDVIKSSEIGNYSHNAVRFDTYGYGYLHTSDGTIGKLDYVRDDMLHRLFGIDASEDTTSENTAGAEIVDSISADLIASHSDIEIINEWISKDFGYTVLFGSLKDDPQQGVAVVIPTGDQENKNEQKILTPEKHGAIKAESLGAKASILDVIAEDGYKWIFNVYNGFSPKK